GAIVPVLEYCHGDTDASCSSHPFGCSVTGGFVYRGCAMPDLQGRYFYSDYCTTWIRSFKGVSGGNAQDFVDHSTALGAGTSITGAPAWGEDAGGELYTPAPGSSAGRGGVGKIAPGS